ncbi:MAG: cbb3-type cytochrome oxidase assembly protein CcoS [Rhodospirillum sp.]|nr:cbb3-type cytochrome oxidase assembly protein CcoS [Rhodospirillum sp.]MCF8491153.1 cbb3-type cytochrome oxidase assembly protein CcoS [Rhodospirillum sp.]MCF8503040.1 cbb3-type cytochrome oxidase assembly protein CcoS [Rhodospirillum sp.]
MDVLLYLIPVALGMGAIGLGAFLWALKSGQFEDLDGAAHRILFEDDAIPPPPTSPENSAKSNGLKNQDPN